MVTSDSEGNEVLQFKLDRTEKRWIITTVITVSTVLIGLVSGLMLFVFQTKSESIEEHKKRLLEHAQIEQKIAIQKAVLDERKETRDKRDEEIDKKLSDQGAAISVVHTNIQRVLWQEGLKAKPLPANVKRSLGAQPPEPDP